MSSTSGRPRSHFTEAARPRHPPSGKEQLAGRASIGFNVEDLDKVFQDIKSKGARVVMPPTQREGEGIRLAVFLDPDGLPVSFAQTIAQG